MRFDPVALAGDAISEAMHTDFVELTGDRNPLHADTLAARRLPFGERTVHGSHLAIRALMTLVTRNELRDQQFRRVRARYLRPVPVGGEIRCEVVSTSSSSWTARILHDVWTVAEVSAWTEPGRPILSDTDTDDADIWERDVDPVDRTGQTLLGQAGEISLVRGAEIAQSMVAEIAADVLTLTRLVGMEMPGRHSMSAGFDLERRPGTANSLGYAVSSFDDRFGKVTLDVQGRTLGGTLTAFVRPDPVTQPEPASWSVRPSPGEFAGQRALVVGGSRGLGELTARLLAEGGAQVTLTHRVGADDADRVASSLSGTGHQVRRLDVSDPADVATLSDVDVTHLYFFASPAIFRGVNRAYSDALVIDFRRVYVDGLSAVIDALDPVRLAGVFVPSSLAVEQPASGLAEFADVKREAEALLGALANEHSHLRVVARRLPRLATDQTVSQVPIDTADAVAELLPGLRAVALAAPT